MKKLAIVIPCYNEENNINKTAREINHVLLSLIEKSKISRDSFIYFVDDGSSDKTWDLILGLNKENQEMFKGLKLSRNFGHQNALLSGLFYSKDRADLFITIDADLQDDINVIEDFIDAYDNEGVEIVYGVRRKRTTDSFFKKETADIFYKLMILMGVNITFNHADYRMASKKAIEALFMFNEVNLFLRGMFPLLGFKTKQVFYDRKKRELGESKYGVFKMFSLAFDGITSFSIVPLRAFMFFSLIIFFISIILGVYSIIEYLAGNTIQGWTSTVLIVLLMGSLQCFGIGLLGEYIGKIYSETKSRPRFIKEEEVF